MNEEEINRIVRDLFNNNMTLEESINHFARDYFIYGTFPNNLTVLKDEKEPIIPTKNIDKHTM